MQYKGSTYQLLEWTTERKRSTETETVDQMEPVREICITGNSQGNTTGW
jgi:hypothetical protein